MWNKEEVEELGKCVVASFLELVGRKATRKGRRHVERGRPNEERKLNVVIVVAAGLQSKLNFVSIFFSFFFGLPWRRSKYLPHHYNNPFRACPACHALASSLMLDLLPRRKSADTSVTTQFVLVENVSTSGYSIFNAEMPLFHLHSVRSPIASRTIVTVLCSTVLANAGERNFCLLRRPQSCRNFF